MTDASVDPQAALFAVRGQVDDNRHVAIDEHGAREEWGEPGWASPIAKQPFARGGIESA